MANFFGNCSAKIPKYGNIKLRSNHMLHKNVKIENIFEINFRDFEHFPNKLL